MKADIPATIPASIVNAKAGLVAISAKIVPPAGIDLYNEFVNDVPMINKIGMATMSPIDHLPNIVFGAIHQRCFVILSYFTYRKLTITRFYTHAACLVLIFLVRNTFYRDTCCPMACVTGWRVG
jgi:hypothetical protein